MSAPVVELRKILGRRDVLAVAFGAMVGWSWVILAGEMILRAGTLGSVLAFVAGAVMVLLVGLTYAELTSALSRAGGELSFTYLGLGPAASYICGWTLVLAYVSVCAFEAVALPTVLGYLFPGFNAGRLYEVAGGSVYLSWIAVGVGGSLLLGAFNYLGARLASGFQWLAAAALLLVGAAFFLPGNLQGELSLLTPHFTHLQGFLRVVIMTPFLFVGFDVIPQMAEEVHVPLRALGKLILISIMMAFGWYAMVQWTVGLTLDQTALAAAELPTANAMAKVYGSEWGGRVLVLGGALGIVTSWNAFILGASRLLFAMSRGGMLPAVFYRLHPRYESPVAAIALVTLVTCLAPFFGRPVLVWLVDAGSLAAVVGYFLVAVSFLAIRKRHPMLKRPYSAPAPRLTGVLALLTTLFFIMLYLPGSPSALIWPPEWVIVMSWVVLGIALAITVPRRVASMGRKEQARRILGEHVGAVDLPG